MNGTPISTGVVGVGYLGRFHAQKYASLPNSQLVAVVDTDGERARAIGGEHGAEALTDYRALLGRVDAVSIVTPTMSHYAIAKEFLEHGSHVLVEKPITATLAEAEALVCLARETGRLLMVGHLERFNAARLALDTVLDQPRFIESHRLAPFKPRGTDVSVVLDLMIHDIDIILDMVAAPLRRVDASGTPVLTDAVDIANARLQFENGCVANVTASRVSAKVERKMRIFQQDSYVSLDFQTRTLTSHRRGDGEQYPGIPTIEVHSQTFDEADALKTEISHFLEVIASGRRPLVSGEDGLRALEVAMRIGNLLATEPG